MKAPKHVIQPLRIGYGDFACMAHDAVLGDKLAPYRTVNVVREELTMIFAAIARQWGYALEGERCAAAIGAIRAQAVGGSVALRDVYVACGDAGLIDPTEPWAIGKNAAAR